MNRRGFQYVVGEDALKQLQSLIQTLLLIKKLKSNYAWSK